MKVVRVLSLIFCVSLVFASCSNDNSKAVQDGIIADASKLNDDNTFIDADIYQVQTKASDGTNFELVKVALHRFYSHVSIEDGYYVCDLENGKQINVSESLFNKMKEDLEFLNSQAKERREKGENVILTEVTEEYLQSLLK